MLVNGDRRWITQLHFAFQDENYLVRPGPARPGPATRGSNLHPKAMDQGGGAGRGSRVGSAPSCPSSGLMLGLQRAAAFGGPDLGWEGSAGSVWGVYTERQEAPGSLSPGE